MHCHSAHCHHADKVTMSNWQVNDRKVPCIGRQIEGVPRGQSHERNVVFYTCHFLGEKTGLL